MRHPIFLEIWQLLKQKECPIRGVFLLRRSSLKLALILPDGAFLPHPPLEGMKSLQADKHHHEHEGDQDGDLDV